MLTVIDTPLANDPNPIGGGAAMPTRRVVVLGLVRAGAITVVLTTLYFVLDVSWVSDLPVAVSLPVALAAFVALVTVQVRAVMRADLPGLRAVEALAITLPVFLIIFAGSYHVASVGSPEAFNEPLSKLDSLYFTVTTFTTTGFGDVAPRSDAMRTAVTVQMLADLAVLGIGLRILLSAVQEARNRRAATA